VKEFRTRLVAVLIAAVALLAGLLLYGQKRAATSPSVADQPTYVSRAMSERLARDLEDALRRGLALPDEFSELSLSSCARLTVERAKGNSFALTLVTDEGEWTCSAEFYRGEPAPPGVYVHPQVVVVTPKQESP
jgi:hypothetical protein